VAHAGDLLGLLRHDLRLEQDLIALYADAVRFCVLIGDSDNRTLFSGLLDDEQQHVRDLESWLLHLDASSASTHDARARATF
jgi:bacterioferritin